LEGKVTFQSFRQDVPDVLNAADIFVLPSLWEGLPIGLLEAMAMGKAVIATDVDGTRELVRDKENGLMSEAGNVSSLAGAIVELAQNGTLREQFGRNARKMVQEEFDSVAMTRKIEDIYLSLYNRRSNL
jgi:glycosyltransferase involved in cell wall biosynthesis